MLRLIDIVLILLFGFISISHIDRSVAVELPKAEFLPRQVPDFENWAVLTVDSGGGWILAVAREKTSDTASTTSPTVMARVAPSTFTTITTVVGPYSTAGSPKRSRRSRTGTMDPRMLMMPLM